MTTIRNGEVVNVVVPPQTPLQVRSVQVGGPGPAGPPGAEGQWVSMTAAAFAALVVKDPATLYVIIG